MVKDARDVARNFVQGAIADKLGNIWISGNKLYSNGKVIARRDFCEVPCEDCTNENKFGCFGGNYAKDRDKYPKKIYNKEKFNFPRKMFLIVHHDVPSSDKTISNEDIKRQIEQHILDVVFEMSPVDHFWRFYSGWLDAVSPEDKSDLKKQGYRDSVFD